MHEMEILRDRKALCHDCVFLRNASVMVWVVIDRCLRFGEIVNTSKHQWFQPRKASSVNNGDNNITIYTCQEPNICQEALCFTHIISFNHPNNPVRWLQLYMIANRPKCYMGKERGARRRNIIQIGWRWGGESPWGSKETWKKILGNIYWAFTMYQVWFKVYCVGTSLVVQWLKLHAPNAGGPGLTPGQGTRSHMPQLKSLHVTMKIPHATTKTQHSLNK